MNTLRLTLLSFAVMAVFLMASLLYTLPRRPPNAAQVKSDFLREHRSSSVELVELHDIEEDYRSYWIRYRGFASNRLEDKVYSYRKVKGGGWKLER